MFMHWRKSREPAQLPFLFVYVHWFAALNDVVTVYSGMFVVFGFVMRLSVSRRGYHLYTGSEHFQTTGHLLIFSFVSYARASRYCSGSPLLRVLGHPS